MKNIQIDDNLFVDKDYCNDNQDSIIFISNDKNYYRCKDLIKAWNRYEIELKKIRKVNLKADI